MMKIVITDAKMKIMQSVWSDLNALGNIIVTESDDEDALIQAVADADLVVICYAQITRKIIAAGNKLKAILKWGVGVDSIDMEAANERGLPVCHCPMYGSGTIADHAFALLMALARKLVPLVNALKERRIAGAAIDVFESEPLDLTHPYFSLDNVLVTPHFAYYTEESDNRLDRECLYSARRILNKEILVNVKNGDMLESMGRAIARLPYGQLPYSLNEAARE